MNISRLLEPLCNRQADCNPLDRCWKRRGLQQIAPSPDRLTLVQAKKTKCIEVSRILTTLAIGHTEFLLISDFSLAFSFQNLTDFR